jgi:hypothetical protein
VDSGALFGLGVLMGFGAFGILTKICILPPLRVMRREHALTALVIPHIFRFIGLCFLVPGVVAASLSPAVGTELVPHSEQASRKTLKLCYLAPFLFKNPSSCFFVILPRANPFGQQPR